MHCATAQNHVYRRAELTIAGVLPDGSAYCAILTFQRKQFVKEFGRRKATNKSQPEQSEIDALIGCRSRRKYEM